MLERSPDIELSVIIPVGGRHSDVARLYADYKGGLASLGRRHEIIFVLDGARPEAAKALQQLLNDGERLTVVRLTRSFGEATALMAGFEHARGDAILTLPAYPQIEGAEIDKLVEALNTADVAIGRRWPRAGGKLETFRRWLFHSLLAWVTRLRFHDLGCGARAMKRRVLEEIHLYGDQHRFLAVLANRQGFVVKEVNVRQSPRDQFEGIYRPREYTRSVLDIFTVFFLVRFTKKPLRFFGMLGVSMFGVGALLILYLVVGRLFLDQALATRPALLLSSLLVVLGLQLFALGLLGELIIFTHARNLKDYQVDKVLQYPEAKGATTDERDQGSEPRRTVSHS
jgi:glycosyltransferase involved in cell wall biosynthesis